MKASKLIEQLEKYVEEYGDQDVYLYTDHGQTDSRVQTVDYTGIDPEDDGECPFYAISIYGE